MQHTDWIILDTETTGFASPIFVVEIGAQRMHGWHPVGEPFRKLINQNQNIPPEASRVHGYTREILERDGEPANQVHEALRLYVKNLPVVAYNLDYDLDRVLKPEWNRLGIAHLGSGCFCALRLAQRLLDPVPAGNCKLQTLRQYYRLPERGAHTALGDVETVADLFAQVLRPIAEQRGILTWEALKAYAEDEWYPSRLAFGKHKGKSIDDARRNPELREWLEWLAGSSNASSARMGRWYLRALEDEPPLESKAFFVATERPQVGAETVPQREGIVVYVHPDLQRLRGLIDASRARLAELEAAYTSEKNHVTALQAKIFQRLRRHFEERDRLRLVVNYRQTFLDTLLREGEEEADRVREAYQQADAHTQQEYEDTDAAMEAMQHLSDDEETELKALWRKLVKVFHPDRFANDPVMQETYTKLTGAINTAKDSGDLETLRQIADDPLGYVLRRGWTAIDFGDSDELEQMQKLFNSLEAEILEVIEALNELQESSVHKLYKIVEEDPNALDELVERQAQAVQKQVGELQIEAERLKNEITELTGEAVPGE